MSIERSVHGWYSVTELVTDDTGARWFHTERFMGYTKREAVARFNAKIKRNGWRKVDA